MILELIATFLFGTIFGFFVHFIIFKELIGKFLEQYKEVIKILKVLEFTRVRDFKLKNKKFNN
jgi:hypothetical protein